MTYDAEGVIKRKREDGRKERSEEKEEPRTRKSRGEETTTKEEPEEEREDTGAGEQNRKREPTFTQELKGEEDTASNVIETEEETRKAGRLEDRRNQWATPNPTEEKSGDHLLAGRAPGGTWPSQAYGRHLIHVAMFRARDMVKPLRARMYACGQYSLGCQPSEGCVEIRFANYY
ncbi:hypothetical protein NDU88_004056 [Pleurodeles waltl]|uniref:Uncharacterized protein n=1 Tax=Pleurodeles waltl TaxID=8319 RepID=A0AAV7SHN6_PLEWA|nr:hypothetical protein NDU88_004056 [Pleurodeles waltl]